MAKRKTSAQLDREIGIGGRFTPAINACVKLGLDTTASQLAYAVQSAVGHGVPADEIRRAVAIWWRDHRGSAAKRGALSRTEQKARRYGRVRPAGRNDV